jgi:hypothetical protein
MKTLENPVAGPNRFEAAASCGASPCFVLSIEEVAQLDEEFRSSVCYVLEKNTDLYRALRNAATEEATENFRMRLLNLIAVGRIRKRQ